MGSDGFAGCLAIWLAGWLALLLATTATANAPQREIIYLDWKV